MQKVAWTGPGRGLLPIFPTYGIMYGVKRTTVYLPEELKAALERLAHERGCTEAALIREAVRSLAESSRPPDPTLPLFTGSDPTLAERVDEELQGFGER